MIHNDLNNAGEELLAIADRLRWEGKTPTHQELKAISERIFKSTSEVAELEGRYAGLMEAVKDERERRAAAEELYWSKRRA